MGCSRELEIGHARSRIARFFRISVAVAVALGGTAISASDESQRNADPPPSTSKPAPTRDLRVIIQTRNDEGFVFCALWPDARGYPIEQDRAAHDGSSKRLENQLAQIQFEAVADGEYALACFHDENGNEMLDTNFVGIPTEGTGASNSARGFLGPPSYEAARFVISQGEPNELSIQIDY